MKTQSLIVIAALVAMVNVTFAQGYNYGVNVTSKKDPDKPYKGESYSPYAKRNFPIERLWGDTHLHTNLSLDARTAGVLLSPLSAKNISYLFEYD